jgi:3-methyladenine DNA glycosylase AlkC
MVSWISVLDEETRIAFASRTTISPGVNCFNAACGGRPKYRFIVKQVVRNVLNDDDTAAFLMSLGREMLDSSTAIREARVIT